MDPMTKAALKDSEIFTEYLEIQRQNQAKKQAAKIIEEAQAIRDFEKLEKEIKASPEKIQVFRTLQARFMNDSEYTQRTKKSFVDAVLMLDLD